MGGRHMLWEDKYQWGTMTNNERIQALVDDVFPTYTRSYVSYTPERGRILKEYGVTGTMFLCSDPRVSLAIFNLVEGVLGIKRGIGSDIAFANPLFRASFGRLIDKYERENLFHIAGQSFHFSGTDSSKCCSGQHHSRRLAENHSKKALEEMQHIFMERRHVFPFRFGINTDTGEATFYGYDESAFSCSEALRMSENDIYLRLFEMFRDPNRRKDFPEKVLLFMAEQLVKGNIRNVGTRHVEHPVLQHHHQFVLGVGTGFFPWPRARVLIVNPFEIDLRRSIQKGSRLVGNVIKEGKIGEGFILSTSTTYDNPEELEWAMMESKRLNEFAMGALKELENDPEYAWLPNMATPFPVVMNRLTREVTPVR